MQTNTDRPFVTANKGQEWIKWSGKGVVNGCLWRTFKTVIDILFSTALAELLNC